MNSNDSEKLKKDLLRKLLTGEKLPTDLTFTQELSSVDQNIKNNAADLVVIAPLHRD